MKRLIRKYLPWAVKPISKILSFFRVHYRKSYSQFGEDMVLLSFIPYLHINKKGFYVDVGAFHPKNYSNTYNFYLRGWKGINIDAKPGSMSTFKRKRKRDINLEIGISKEEKKLDFYMFKGSVYNTFSKELANVYISEGIQFDKKVIVDTVTLEHVLDKYLPKNQLIDFISIDVEGLDLEVLESNNWDKYNPKYILVEMHNFDINNIKESGIYEYLVNRNYKLVSVVYITLIFKYEL